MSLLFISSGALLCGLGLGLRSGTMRGAVVMQIGPASAPPPARAAAAEQWYVSVPTSFESLAEQTRRSILGAARQGGHRRVLVQAVAPELDPASGRCKLPELTRFALDVAQPILTSGLLPASLPMVKLLFSSPADATFAGASIFDTRLPVSMLGHPNAVGPRDGAFVIVAPSTNDETLPSEAAANAAVEQLLQQAAGRLVVLINPQLGANPLLLDSFEPAYLMRPLSLAFLEDQYADKVARVRACVLRCYPHEWQVLFEPPGSSIGAGGREGAGAPAKPTRPWRYAGRFDRPPRTEQLEALLRDQLTRERNERFRAQQQEAGQLAADSEE